MLHVVRVDRLLVDTMGVLVRVAKVAVLEDIKVDKVVVEDTEEMVVDIVADLQEVDMLHVVMTMEVDTVSHVQLSIVVMLDTTHIRREENNTICEYQSIYYNLGIYTGFPFFMPKRLLIERIHQVFHIAKQQTWLQKIKALPLPLRYSIAIGLILFGILGILTPIPLGFVFFISGIIVLVGFQKTRNIIFSFVYRLRLHILYGKIYIWWK